eukprot:scaffold85012_cov39-Phaeocystis_antarctica.AAC.1
MRAGIELVHPYRAAQARSRRPETEEEMEVGMEDGARGTEGRIKRRGGRGTIRGRKRRSTSRERSAVDREQSNASTHGNTTASRSSNNQHEEGDEEKAPKNHTTSGEGK